jgi:hypothetical protein
VRRRGEAKKDAGVVTTPNLSLTSIYSFFAVHFSIVRMPGKFLFFFLLFAFPSYSEVFLFGPGADGTNKPPELALNPLEIQSETVIINGVKTKLKISLLGTDLPSSFSILKEKYKGAKFAFNAESLLFEVKDGETRRRLYLVQCGKGPYPTLQFSMNVKDIPKNVKWPNSMPSPPDSETLEIMEFPDRKALFGKLKTSFSSEMALSSVDAKLRADNWIPLSGESGRNAGISAKGEFYIRHNPTEIISVSFRDTDDGGSEGALYGKTIKK